MFKKILGELEYKYTLLALINSILTKKSQHNTKYNLQTSLYYV